MKVSKLLYVAGTKECDLSSCTMGKIDLFQQRGCQQIVFLPIAPSPEQLEELSRLSINSKVLTDRELSPEDIVKTAEEENVSLIMVTTDSDKEGLPIDSTLRDLMEISPIPILVLKRSEEQESSERGLFDHTIFATDWSQSSEKALEYILGFKESMNALEVVHVINEKLTVKDMRQLKDRLVKTRKICLDEGIDAESHIYAGKTWEEIVRASQDYRGTVITLGTGSKKSFWKTLFKEKSLFKIIKEAPVPVLVVP
jgi:nucleotide-binding universal stress UspA family protein